MVDPNRKINRLTDKDIEFLEECEQEFGLRFTDSDTEFVDYCAKPLGDPPIVENWTFGGGGGDDNRRHDGGGRIYYNNRNRQRGNWHDNRGGERSGHYSNNYRRRRGGRGMSSDGGDYGRRNHAYGDYKSHERRNNYEHQDNHQDISNIPPRPPINVRRDYSNFVAASKDD